MNKLSLVGHEHGGWDSLRFPKSRDCADIDCNAVSCMFNFRKKCTTPSNASIDHTGRCKGFRITPILKNDKESRY